MRSIGLSGVLPVPSGKNGGRVLLTNTGSISQTENPSIRTHRIRILSGILRRTAGWFLSLIPRKWRSSTWETARVWEKPRPNLRETRGTAERPLAARGHGETILRRDS